MVGDAPGFLSAPQHGQNHSGPHMGRQGGSSSVSGCWRTRKLGRSSPRSPITIIGRANPPEVLGRSANRTSRRPPCAR